MKFIAVIICILNISVCYSQFTKEQIDELTAKGIYLALEPQNDGIIEKTKSITNDYGSTYNIKQVCAVFDYIYRRWNYTSDPNGMEYFEKAGVSLYTMTGDCDDYSTLIVSMLKSLGGDGRIVCVSGHAYPELYLGMDLPHEDLEKVLDDINKYYKEKGSRTHTKYLNYHRDYNGSMWLNLDYQERFPGGRYVEYSPSAEHLVIYSDGSYRLAYLNNE